jgi:ubiquinone/menaquinone biosynthesis C-methylase UbiE
MSGLPSKFHGVSPEEWLTALKSSVSNRVVDGETFPLFPSEAIQLGYNGTAGEAAMTQAHALWSHANRYCKQTGTPLGPTAQLLDIGCGWGRVTRMFMGDIPAERIFGVDIDPNAISLCQSLQVPGTFIQTYPNQPLPFPDNFFTVITGLSVFTHLPENVATALIAEMTRVAAPGCIMVFTVEDISLLQRIGTPGVENWGDRWRMMCEYRPELPQLYARYEKAEYIYLVTNREEHRSADVYGDAVVPKAWLEQEWKRFVDILAYAPACEPLHQAVVVARKPSS